MSEEPRSASSSDLAMADTQRRGSHESSVDCGSGAVGPGTTQCQLQQVAQMAPRYPEK